MDAQYSNDSELSGSAIVVELWYGARPERRMPMTPEREARLVEVFKRRQTDLTLITDKVHKPRNLAALIRNCDAVGIPQFHYVQPEVGYRTFRGTTRGSDRWVEAIEHETLDDAILSVRQAGMKIYAAHLSERAVDFRSVDYTQPCAIVMGAERDGISAQAAALADQHIVIPMLGMVESFNVATAAGIILVEAQRQRLDAGLYQRQGLDQAAVARYLFEARYPRLADYALLCNEPYPDYNLRGELTDPDAAQSLIARGSELAQQARRKPRKRN